MWVVLCIYSCAIQPVVSKASFGKLPASEPHLDPTPISFLFSLSLCILSLDFSKVVWISNFLSKLACSGIAVFYFGFAHVIDQLQTGTVSGSVGCWVARRQREYSYSLLVFMESNPNCCLLIGSIIIFWWIYVGSGYHTDTLPLRLLFAFL